MATALEDLIARWDSDEGKPYKGSLIDWERYGGDGLAPPTDLGCACAQGQVLLAIGGWEPRRLHDTEQSQVDKDVAELLGISRAHAILLRSVNDKVDGAPSIVLTAPEKVLGDQANIVLAFWRHMDRMTPDQWGAAWDAAWGAARGAAWGAASYACAEIQGARIMRENGKPFFFLPMFGFADPEAVLAADLAFEASR